MIQNRSLLKLALAIGLIGANYTSTALSSVDGDYFVSPYGSDSNPGTFDQPFATVQKAQSIANAGDVIYFRGGDYTFIGTDDTDGIGVLFNKSGTKEAPISYFAYPGEVPVFDFSYFQPQARIRGFSVRANWLHFKGFEIKGVQQILTNVNESWGIRVENNASYNIFENLNLHHNEGPGLFIADGRDNLVLNVDSHHNYDPDRGGENADGFGCHSNDGGNVFRGCRAWSNSDDGFDFINAPGTCSVEYSMAFYNGYIPGTNTGAGNGTGIKAGGFGLDSSKFPSNIPRHLVRFNISFGNRINGFYSNHHPGGLDFINNTAFNNPYNYNMLADVGSANHFLRNNVSFGSGIDLAKATIHEIDSSHNSWDLDVTVDKNDFMSVNETLATADREADGSLPMNDFLRLLTDSDLIDAGENVGYSYNGNAPDLGAFELGSNDEQLPAPAISITLNSKIRNGSVELSWSVTNADFSVQEIYRDSDPNPSGRTRITSLGGNERSFIDNSPNAGSTYYYWVKGIKRDGSMINSNVSSATLPNTSDTSPTIEESVTLNNQVRNGSVELSWSVTNADFSAHDIYRDSDPNPSGRVRIARLGANVNSYVDNSPKAGNTYYYWVKGIKRDGNMINSNVSSATLSN
jgi:hypothetical protein